MAPLHRSIYDIYLRRAASHHVEDPLWPPPAVDSPRYVVLSTQPPVYEPAFRQLEDMDQRDTSDEDDMSIELATLEINDIDSQVDDFEAAEAVAAAAAAAAAETQRLARLAVRAAAADDAAAASADVDDAEARLEVLRLQVDALRLRARRAAAFSERAAAESIDAGDDLV